MLNRRDWLRATGWGLCGTAACNWFPLLAQEIEAAGKRRRHCVLLWMSGGATQTDTFDMKAGHQNGGEFKEIATRAPGLRWSEHLPKLAEHAERIAVVRGLSTKEGDHGRGTYLMRTGHQPMGTVRYPGIGSSLSKELADVESGIPAYVAISPYRAFNQAAFGPGFLGAPYAPLTVGATDGPQAAPASSDGYAELRVDDLVPPNGISPRQFTSRVDLWRAMQERFLASHRTHSVQTHDTVYRRALKLMSSDMNKAFDLSQESDAIREAYGKGRFGQGCLLARRLIERGVGFVEVSLGTVADGAIGWDTHLNNFPVVKALSTELDAGWSMLMRELGERGLLDNTTILWMGEFGRTPAINPSAGRDHFPAAWTCVFAGGGIRGGQAYGKTSDDGMRVEDGKVDVGDVLATLSSAVGVDPSTQNISEVGRPIKIAEGTPISAILS